MIAEFSNRKKNIKRRLIFFLKLTLTVVLCSFIFWKVDWENVWKALKSSNPILLLIVFFCMIFCVTISAYKWQRLLLIHGIKFDFTKLHQYYFTALFFNNFLPSSIGGDTYRIFKTLNNPNSKVASFVAVFFERITGFWALLVLGFISAIIIFLQKHFIVPHLELIIGLFGLGVIVPAIAFLMSDSLRLLLQYKFIPEKIKKLPQLLNVYHMQGEDTMLVIFISFFFHIFTLFWMILLLRAIGTSCSVFSLVLAVSISNLVAVLPISLNGIGLMDGSFIFIMGLLGMNYEFSLVFMLINRLFTIIISLSGIFFYLSEKRSPDIQEFQPDQIKSLKKSIL